MNVPTAIPAHVGEDGVWLQFVSPKTGKQASLNVQTMIDKTGGIVAEAMQEWHDAQMAAHRIHNPKPASADVPR